MKPAEYWRKRSNWSKYLLRTGKVIASSHIFVAPAAQSEYSPYSFVVVDVNGERVECMGVPNQHLKAGDEVRFVLRRVAASTTSEPIPYGLKVEKIV
ncbi:hypothetical protein KC721_00940 [Candidatus Woesebacteria bacterium]|nr:hypothetical protein [Candidatus Woesebacteria bacterium]